MLFHGLLLDIYQMFLRISVEISMISFNFESYLILVLIDTHVGKILSTILLM